MSKSPDHKPYPIRRALISAGAVLSTTALAACSADGPQPVKIVTVTAPIPSVSPKTSEASSTPSETSANPASQQQELQKQALTYLQSPDRADQFKGTVTKAASLLAHAIVSGQFGHYSKLDDNKAVIQPDYSGWGSVQTTDEANGDFSSHSGYSGYTDVYFKNGKIDYSQPGTTISLKSGDAAQKIYILGPIAPIPPGTDQDFNFWTVELTSADYTTTAQTDLTNIGAYRTQSGLELTTSLSEIQDLDAQGLNALNANMSTVFGKNWNS